MKRQTTKEINERLKIGKAVKITWGDAHGGHDISYQYSMRLSEIQSYGIIVSMSKETVALAAFEAVEAILEVPDDFKNRFRYILVIPRKCIWRVRLI